MQFQKITRSAVFCFAAPAANFWKRHVSSALEKAFPGFLGDFLVSEFPQKRRCFDTQEFTRFFSTGTVSALNHVLWRVRSNKVIWVLGHCWVDILHIHTSLWDSLFFQNCLLSTVTDTLSDLDYVNRIDSRQRFRLIHTNTIASTILRIRTTGCMRIKQSPDKIVAHCSDEGGLLLRQGPRRRREETAWKWRRIKTSLVVVVFVLRVMTCIIFYIKCFGIELVLCDFCLTRFDLTRDSLFDNFFVAVFNK